MLLTLLLAFIMIGNRDGGVKYYIPEHLHLSFGLIFIYGIFSTYLNTSSYIGLVKISGLFLVIFLAFSLSKYFMLQENSENYYKIIILITSLVVGSSFLLFVLGVNLGRVSEDGGRFSGWVDNPNTLAMMLMIVFPVVLLNSLKDRRLGLFSPRILLFFLITIVALTGSRSAAAGIGVAAIVIFSYQKGGKERLVLLSIVSIAVVTLVGFELKDVILNIVSYKRFGNLILSGREEVWAVAFMLIQNQPYFGYGFDTETTLIDQYHHLLITHQGKVFHNSYLSYIVHLGLIGAMPLLWIIIYSIRSLMFLRFHSNNPEEFRMRLVSAAIVFSSLVHAIFETWLFSPGNLANLIFWVALFSLNCRARNITPN